MENTPKIYAAMCNAMADIEAIGKNQVNQQQKFKYRGIDDAMNALFPVMQKHRLFLAPEVLEHRREERQTKSGGNLIYSILKVRYTMYTDDGSSVSATVIGEGMDSADKSSNKAIAAAMKYAIFQLFCIPTAEMTNDDPDKSSPEASTPEQKASTPEQKASTPEQKASTPEQKASTPEQKASTPEQKEDKSQPFLCKDCGSTVLGTTLSTGKVYTPAMLVEMSVKKYGRCLCLACAEKAKASES